MEIVKLSRKYFELFSEGDINGLRNIYDNNILLIDWKGQWSGIDEVLNMNRSLFDEFSPNVEIKKIDFVVNRTYCLIHIKVGEEILKVIDVIDFSNDGKIIRIEAFKG